MRLEGSMGSPSGVSYRSIITTQVSHQLFACLLEVHIRADVRSQYSNSPVVIAIDQHPQNMVSSTYDNSPRIQRWKMQPRPRRESIAGAALRRRGE